MQKGDERGGSNSSQHQQLVAPRPLSRVSTLAVRLAAVRQILGVGDQLQMVRIPAGIDAAAMMQFPALRYGAAEELPTEWSSP